MLILTVGISGVGKTTILKKVVELSEKKKFHLKYIGDWEKLRRRFYNYLGDKYTQYNHIEVVFKKTPKVYYKSKYDETIKDSIDEYRTLNVKRNIYLFDTHIFHSFYKDYFFPYTDSSLIKDIMPDYIIFLYALPKSIYERREKKPFYQRMKKASKYICRQSSIEDDILVEQEIEKKGAIFLSLLIGKPILFLRNEGSIVDVSHRLLDAIETKLINPSELC